LNNGILRERFFSLCPTTACLLSEVLTECFQAMQRNAVEDEPFFLLTAYAWSQPEWAPAAVELYVYSRIAHFVFYMILRIQPWRAVLWMVGLVINMVISWHVICGLSLGPQVALTLFDIALTNSCCQTYCNSSMKLHN